jgi:UDP-N-acetylmuramoylalanine-D-glutamate ligase
MKTAFTNKPSQSLFTPCTVVHSLLEAVQEAARNSASGDVVLLSPSCSKFAQYRDQEQCGEAFYTVLKSIDGGAEYEHPNIHGKIERN